MLIDTNLSTFKVVLVSKCYQASLTYVYAVVFLTKINYPHNEVLPYNSYKEDNLLWVIC